MARSWIGNWTWSSILWFAFVSALHIEEFTGNLVILASKKSSVHHHKEAKRRIDDIVGSISIDYGLPEELSYTDNGTRIPYTSDKGFIDTGTNKNISAEFITETPERTFTNLRSFSEGKRNCYKLNPPEGKDTIYLIKASFMYGNYDGLNWLPEFELYVGVNSWDVVKFDNATHVVRKEILHVPLMDDIYVCLVDTDKGTPFISALELRHFHNSSYRTKSESLVLYGRFDIGSTTNEIVTYNQDAFDRIWSPYSSPDYEALKTSLPVDSLQKTEYWLPSTVMRTAARPKIGTESLEFQFEIGDPTLEFYVYMHFAEVEKLKENESREFNITLNGNLLVKSVKPNYLHSSTVNSPQSIRGSKLMFSMHKKLNSTHPPILNAIEIYIVKDFLQAPTNQKDVKAIMDIKSRYSLGRTWQGDPCAPIYSWNGVNCSRRGYDAPRITALSLTSIGLEGTIISLFSKLQSLEYLDLSNNSLTGSVPDFLSQLPNLKTLNLSGNRLSGEIPSVLKERSINGSLSLSGSKSKLCLMAPCKKEEKNFVPLIAAIVSSVVSFIIVAIVFGIIWRWKHNRKPARQAVVSYDEVVLKSNNKQFTYSQMLAITNNFEKMIGKGGFGTVYHGSLYDGTQVAVKMLSPKVELLMRVHHKNLASFLGYCSERRHTAIIYEYMAYGNLEEYLTDARREPLNWKQRIQIAVDAAQGLEYLHHGCKPPIIHRDIKTANILLNEKLQAKVADFGLSKFLPTESESHILTTVVGTLGYLDPEYYTSSRLTEKSDVYSFGIVLLELITGQPAIIRGHENIHIVQWVTPSLARGDLQQIVDPKIWGDFDFDSMWKAVEAAIACVPSISIQRPSMSFVVAELKECLEMEAAHEQTRGMNGKTQILDCTLEMEVVDLETESGPEAR